MGCFNDEALDLEYDKQLDIDCAAVRTAIAARRGSAEQARHVAMVSLMRSNQPHCCVSREQLVAFLQPEQGLAPALSAAQQGAWDRAVGRMLCDPLTREIQTRHYVTQNPACAAGETPPSDLAPTGPAGGAP